MSAVGQKRTFNQDQKLFTAEARRRREKLFLLLTAPAAQLTKVKLCASAVQAFKVLKVSQESTTTIYF